MQQQMLRRRHLSRRCYRLRRRRWLLTGRLWAMMCLRWSRLGKFTTIIIHYYNAACTYTEGPQHFCASPSNCSELCL